MVLLINEGYLKFKMKTKIHLDVGKLGKVTLVLACLCTSTNIFAASLSHNFSAAYLNPINIGNEISTSATQNPTTHSKINQQAENVPPPRIASSVHEEQFILRKVVLTGALHIVPAQVFASYQDALNKPTDFTQLQILATKLQAAYRKLGYILVRVILPSQEVDPEAGEVKFQVIEGRINKVIFTGDDPRAAKDQLLRYAEAIQAEDPIRYSTLERFLSLANNLAGVDVTATLVPSKDIFGGADLIINVKAKQQSAYVNFNNRGTSYVGPEQLIAGASIYNILGADAMSINMATTPYRASEFSYLNAGYDIVVGRHATEINASLTSTRVHPGGALTIFDLAGNSAQYALAVNQPLIVSPTQNLTLQTSLTHLNSSNTVFNSFQLYDDSISTLIGGLDYQGIFWQSYNDINASTTLGLPILGAPAHLSHPSRINGKTQFIIFNLTTATTYYLTNQLSFLFNSALQLTPSSLLSSEQIGYGGSSFGQAYIPYIISGDTGLMGAIALRYDLPSYKWLKTIQPELFYDAGLVAENQPLPGAPRNSTGSSAGVGLNLQLGNTWNLSGVLAKPVSLKNALLTNKNWQAFFNITGIF